MPTPSLLIVPARFKSGKLYSQIPTSGAGDFTVTRATAATRVNASGYIESVASGIPRLDYFASGGTVGCPALLVEPSGSNLALQSEAWNVSPWAATSGGQGSTISGNVTTSPDGTTNADKLIEAATTGTHFCLQNLTLTSGTTYTASFFVKASERTLGRFRVAGSIAYWDIDFNLTAGTVTGGTNPFIQNYGNGWYRIGGTFTANQASNNFLLTLRDASGNTLYTGDGTSGFFVWGAQLETGSVATSYIPTTTAAVTRNADVVSVSGAVSGSIGQTDGTIYLDLTVLSKGSSSTRWLQIFGASNNIGLATNSSNQFRSIVNAQSDVLLTAPLISSGVKVAWAYDGSGVICFVNGTQYTLTTGGNQTMSSLTSISIDGSANTAFGFARIRAAALYNTRLTNAQLAALTIP